MEHFQNSLTPFAFQPLAVNEESSVHEGDFGHGQSGPVWRIEQSARSHKNVMDGLTPLTGHKGYEHLGCSSLITAAANQHHKLETSGYRQLNEIV